MSGRDLYGLWQDALLEQGQDTDGWDELDETDRVAWNVAGQQVELRIA